MYIYFITLISAYMFLLLARVVKKYNNFISKIFAILSFLTVWIISAIRYGVGTDFFYYYNFIKQLETVQIRNSEYGFKLIGLLIKSFSNNGQLLIIICSFVTIFLVYKVILKETTYPELSILLFFGLGYYFNSLNIIRQYLAISLVFYASGYLLNKRKVFFLLLMILASLFHYSALVALLLIVTFKLKDTKFLNTKFIILGFICIFIFYDNFIGIALSFGDYSIYKNTRYIIEGANPIFFFIYFSITIVLTIFKTKIVRLNIKNEIYFLYILIGTGILLLGTKSLLLTRLSEYFTIFTLLILPDLIRISENRYLKAIMYIGMVIICFVGLYLFLSKNLGGVLPYRTFL